MHICPPEFTREAKSAYKRVRVTEKLSSLLLAIKGECVNLLPSCWSVNEENPFIGNCGIRGEKKEKLDKRSTKNLTDLFYRVQIKDSVFFYIWAASCTKKIVRYILLLLGSICFFYTIEQLNGNNCIISKQGITNWYQFWFTNN